MIHLWERGLSSIDLKTLRLKKMEKQTFYLRRKHRISINFLKKKGKSLLREFRGKDSQNLWLSICTKIDIFDHIFSKLNDQYFLNFEKRIQRNFHLIFPFYAVFCIFTTNYSLILKSMKNMFLRSTFSFIQNYLN